MVLPGLHILRLTTVVVSLDEGQIGGSILAAAQIELFQHIMHMVLHCADANDQVVSNHLVGMTLGQESQDFALALGEVGVERRFGFKASSQAAQLVEM